SGTQPVRGRKVSEVNRFPPIYRWIMTDYVWYMRTRTMVVHPGGKHKYSYTDGPDGTGGSWVNRLYIDGSVHLIHLPQTVNYPYTGGDWRHRGDVTPFGREI
ncbi:MAG: hypothetical protein NC911_10955, partial [Candidatus Omnitrophica bacterium]|nr:hypothetical protein [Candidatus Omnitrophota bacterium]